jgi:hypothetical protein
MKNSLLILLLLSLNTFAQPGWQTLKAKEYSIKYPADWTADKTGQMGATFFLFSPADSESDAFRENINLLEQDLSAYNLDLNGFAALSEKQITTMVKDANVIESKRVKSKGNEFHKMIYSGEQSDMLLTFEQYYWVKNKKAYILTFTCTQENFERFKKTGEEIMASFVLQK